MARIEIFADLLSFKSKTVYIEDRHEQLSSDNETDPYAGGKPPGCEIDAGEGCGGGGQFSLFRSYFNICLALKEI